jgi:ATP-dependent RNA helicase DDX18/HAS1
LALAEQPAVPVDPRRDWISAVPELDLQAVGLAFGFTTPPRVDLAFSARGNKRTNKKMAAGKGKMSSGHGFSASNPYGKQESGDQRQFSY